MQQLWCPEITHRALSLGASMLCCGDGSTELSFPRAHSSLLGKAAAPNPQNSCTYYCTYCFHLAPHVQTTQPVTIAGRGAGLPPIPYFIVKTNSKQKRNCFPCIKRGLTKRFKNSIVNPFLKFHTPTLNSLVFILYVMPLKQEILALIWSKPGLTVMTNCF